MIGIGNSPPKPPVHGGLEGREQGMGIILLTVS
jgi:hypothetical protein